MSRVDWLSVHCAARCRGLLPTLLISVALPGCSDNGGESPSSTATKLAFSTQPSGASIHEALSPFQVALQNASGELVSDSPHTVTVTLNDNPTSAVLSGTTSVNSAAGVASFSDVRINTPGTGYTLEASVEGLTPAISAPFVVPRSNYTLAYHGSTGVEFTDTAGTEHRTVLPSGAPLGWSPDGRSLALSDGNHVWHTSADGLLLIASAEFGTFSAGSWSPDGRELLLESGFAGNHVSISIARYPVDGSSQFHGEGVYGEFGQLVCPDGTWANWSPDGSQIVVHHGLGDRQVYIVSRDGTGKRLLVEGRQPDWSPDGGAIAYVADAPVCGGTYRIGRATLHLIAPDGTNDRQLSAPAANETDEAPVWSPDGSTVAFVRLGVAPDSAVTSVLAYLVNADGSNARQLAVLPLSEVSIEYVPSWSPDGLHLAYSGRGGTYLVNADGSGFHMVSDAPAFGAAQWGR